MFPTLEGLVQFLALISREILQHIGNAVTSIGNGLLFTFSQMRSFFAGLIQEFRSLTLQFGSFITSFILQLREQLSGFFQQLVNSLFSFFQPFIDEVRAWLAGVGTWILAQLRTAFQFFVDKIQAVFREVISAIREFIRPAVEWFERVSGKVAQLIEQVIDDAQRAFNEFERVVRQSWEDLLGGTGSFIAAIETRLGDLRSAFVEAASEVGKSLAESAGKPLDDIKSALIDSLKGFASLADPETIAGVATALSQTFSPNTLELRNRADAHRWVMQFLPKGEIGRILFMTLTSAGMALNVYSGIAQANAQVLLQEFAAEFNYQLLSPADAALAVFRQDMDRDEAIQAIIRQGYTARDANRLIDNATSIPGIGELLSMRLRGEIEQEDFQKAMVRHGLSRTFENAYIALSQIIPPVSDLITMAVKGSFSPDEISTFRTLEDFPESIVPWAEKQGLSREWMERYWSAHWNLPSPGQGFEMFQRGIINRDQLNILLKALDITPFWRDKMINLSFNVLTRVDVRRMHQLGILNENQVVDAHMAMGYSPEDAERLLRFVVALNKGKPGETEDELGRLSRTNVIGFYQDGVIPRERAISLLVDIGYTPEAATLFIDTADFDAERTQRAAEIEFIIASATAGVLDFGEAQDRLNQLNLSPTEIDRAIAKLLREQTKQTKLPTVEQGTKMFAGKAISEEQFRDLLRRLGYKAQWAEAFVKLAKKPEGKAS